jgi:ribulose-phosphate 3-epimerase
MKKIVPAILTNDPAQLEKMIKAAEDFCDLVQIDIMDGKFVPSQSISSEDLKKIKTKLYLEVHLMVNEPEKYFKGFAEAGAKCILFHFEATDKPAELIKTLKSMGLSPGIVINPGTPVDSVRPFTNDIDVLLLMAVNPGFYGAPFIPEVLDKARAISEWKKKFILSLDGGVKLDNVVEIARAGVEQIDVGSAIFKGENPKENYKKFEEKLKMSNDK